MLCLACAIAGCVSAPNAAPQAADDEIKLQIQLNLEEDIGLLLIDYDADGVTGSGGVSNANKSKLKRDEVLDFTFNQQQFEGRSRIERLQITFTVLTEYVEPNFEAIYPEELKRPMDVITLKADFGSTCFITISGGQASGYRAAVEES